MYATYHQRRVHGPLVVPLVIPHFAPQIGREGRLVKLQKPKGQEFQDVTREKAELDQSDGSFVLQQELQILNLKA